MLLGASSKFVKGIPMVLALDVITSARDILSDPAAKRYSNELLIRLLNEGLKNFAIATKFSRKKAFIAIEENVSLYDMGSYAFSIDRVQYMEKVLVAKTEDEMDKINPSWELEVGETPLYIVFSNLRQGSFRIYPKITTNVASPVTQNQVYGGLIDIDIVEDLLYLPGIDTDAFAMLKYLIVYYVGIPTLVANLNSEIEINSIHIPALVAYVSGQALRVDHDSQNRQFGAEQLTIYNDYIIAANRSEQSSYNTSKIYTIPYKGFT